MPRPPEAHFRDAAFHTHNDPFSQLRDPSSPGPSRSAIGRGSSDKYSGNSKMARRFPRQFRVG